MSRATISEAETLISEFFSSGYHRKCYLPANRRKDQKTLPSRRLFFPSAHYAARISPELSVVVRELERGGDKNSVRIERPRNKRAIVIIGTVSSVFQRLAGG